MSDNARLLDRIERAIHDVPFCSACGAPTRVVEADDGLWLECSALEPGGGLIHRISVALVPHARDHILTRDELLPAA